MLIRSQNKEFLININNSFVIEVVSIEGDFKVVCLDQCNDYSVGCYSTEGKALKVLDMIQEAYADFEASKITSTGLASAAYTGGYDTPESVAHGIKVLKGYAKLLKEAVVFQMPEDRSAEV